MEPIAPRSHRGYAGIIPPDLEPPVHLTGSSGCFDLTGGEGIASEHSMHEIGLSRTGANRYFPTVPDGWIRIACGRL